MPSRPAGAGVVAVLVMCGAGQPHIELLEIEDKRLQLSEALAVLLEDVVGLGLAAYADLLCHQPRDFDASIA